MTPRTLMTASAAVLGIAGLALLFVPVEVHRLVAAPNGPQAASLALQLWSAALLGLGAVDWIGRGLMLGGIYGRALVVGNLVHWTVGALVAVRAVIDRPGSAVLWAVVAVYGGFALGFTWLLRRRTPP